MADGGQRLLDVIDDPNALESFLGGLTSASDLLPSAESVDTVVASLAQSLAADYDVDSPNDTLFDTLEASSNNLTDISQSYVPSDFDNANVYGLSNGLSQSIDHSHLTPTSSTGQGQPFVTTQAGPLSGGASADINVEALVNSTLQQQYPTSVCDSNSSFVHTPQQQHPQLEQPTANSTTSNSFNQNFSQLAADLHTQQQNVSRIPSLSSSSNSNSIVNVVNNNNKNEGLQVAVSTLTATNSSNLISPASTVTTSSCSSNARSITLTNTVGNLVTTAAGLVSYASQQQQQQTKQIQDKETSVSIQNQQNICGVISSVSNAVGDLTNNISTSGGNINLQIQQSQQQQQPQTQQFIVSASNINQLVQQGQAVSLASMTMGPQLMSSNANGGLVSSVISSGQGGNLMQFQSAGQHQQFIVDQSTSTLIAAGGTTFGAANLALVAGTPTYAVLPTSSQIFANAIVQPQLQALKNSGQTFFQTASGSLVAANSIQGLQGMQNINLQSIRAKQQPQILPKPALHANVVTNLTPTSSNSNVIPNNLNVSTSSDNLSTATVTGIAGTATAEQSQQQQQQQQQHSVSVNVGQLLQQQAQQLHQVQTTSGIVTSVSNGNMRFSQPSFTFSNAPGLGQVMVSGVGNMNSTMSAPQQAQLAGTTIVLNQFGQPVLLPTAGASQNNGLQLILRQQPAQPQVLTIQAPAGTTTLGAPAAQATNPSCKPVVRYVPQMPQNQTVQIQQIQTPNGPAYIAVRCPPTSQASTPQFITSQIQAEPAPQATPAQPQQQQQQQQQQQPQATQAATNLPPVRAPIINSLQQQTLASITQKTQQQITIKTERVDTPRQSFLQNQNKSSAIPDSTITAPPPPPTPPPPKKKPSKKKKKVMLDLDDILRQSGIGDEDLQDDGLFDNSISNHMAVHPESTNGYQNSPTNIPQNQIGTQPVKPNGSLSKSPTVPMNILSPHVHVLKPTTHVVGTPKNQRNNKAANSAGGAGSSNVSNNKKASPKKTPTKRKAPVEKKNEPPSKVPTTSTTQNKSSAQNKNTGQNKNSPQNKKNSPNKNNSNNFNNNNNVSTNSSKKKNNSGASTNKKNAANSKSPAAPRGSKVSPAKRSIPVPVTTSATTSSFNPTPQFQSSQLNSALPITSPSPAASITIPTSISPSSSTPPTQTQRIVHTIQLTPQNQQLLRNIQAQITRLVSLPKRNENEQTALQKLIYLQQQVIATGTPVSNSTSINNVNLNNNALAMPGGTSTASTVVSLSSSMTSSTSSLIASPNNNIIIPKTLSAQPPSINSIITIPATTSCLSTVTTTTANNAVVFNQNSLSSTGQMIQVTVNNCLQISDSTILTPTTAHSNFLSKEKTDVINNLLSGEGVDQYGNTQGQVSSGSTVLVVEDPKIVEQRRAAAKAEEEARARWKKEQFEFLLKRDQDFCVEPDYKTPFTSKQDAVERLMKYHLYRDTTEMDYEDFDQEFSDTAVRLLDKFACMVSKYKFLMLKESMKEVSCAERVMVERTFCNEEKLKLEQDKLLVAQGEILELPPPPSTWMPKLKDMVDADMKELQLDTDVNLQVQSAIDSIISCGTSDTPDYLVQDESEKIEYDAFGVPTTSNSNYASMGSSSSADIDEAVRSILA